MRFISLPSLLTLATPLWAFTIGIPTNPTSGELTNIHWGFTATDPKEFSLFLMNSTQAFGLIAVLGESLQTDLGQIMTQLPVLPARVGYQLRAVEVDNVDFVLAFSPVFAISA
ncbi:hypothetical protein DFH09DRAFT_1370958 [Mycena vulgaris]|nr:hypothetical protein DFH09DRAFT_1370958 [Mycena vulgaris]